MEPDDTRRRLELVPVGGVSRAVLAPLARALRRRLAVRAAVGAPLPLYPEWVEGDGRCRSTPLVDALLARAAAEGGDALRLGVAGCALAAPGGEAVFGEAAVGGFCAVLSLAPLASGAGETERLLLRRLVKEAVHELAHAAGLDHCADPACVMYPSRDIADTDRKAADFCTRCRTCLSPATLDVART